MRGLKGALWLMGVLVTCATAEPRIRSVDGDVVIEPQFGGRVRLGGPDNPDPEMATVATRANIEELHTKLLGAIGLLIGPDVQLRVELFTPATAETSWLTREQTVTASGLTSGLTPFTDVAGFVSKAIAAQGLCVRAMPEESTSKLRISVDSVVTEVPLSVNTPGQQCVNADAAVNQLMDSMSFDVANVGGLLGKLRRFTTESDNQLKSDLGTDIDDVEEMVDDTRTDLATLSNQVNKNNNDTNARVDTVLRTVGAVELNLTLSISGLRSSLGLVNSTLDTNLQLTAAVANCHAQGRLYNQVTKQCVVAIDVHCIGRPPTAPAFSVVAGTSDGNCNEQSTTHGGPPCLLTCPAGFTTNGGVANYSCSVSGGWVVNAQTLACTPVNCGTPAAVPGLAFSCTSTIFGGRGCNVSCASGFEAASGTTRATCNADGTWAVDLACRRIRCPITIPLLPNQAISNCTNNNLVGATCVASCGSSFQGSFPYTCNAEGVWTTTLSTAQLQCSSHAMQGFFNQPDTVNGCPATSGRDANTPLITRTFNVQTDSVIWIVGHIIRRFRGRADLHLIVDGHLVDLTISYSGVDDWTDARVYWTGNIGRGTHTATLQSPTGNVWGCGSDWGDLDAFWLSSTHARVVQLDDTEPGCPQTGRSSRLLSASFTTATSKSLLISAGHIIRNSVGRSQLQLSVDDTVFDRALVFTPIQDWLDMSVFTTREVGLGTHSLLLSSGENAGIFGCGRDWGGLNFMVIEDESIFKSFSAYDTRDTRAGCPGALPAQQPFISMPIDVTSNATVVYLYSSIICSSTTRTDVLLRINGNQVDRSLTAQTNNLSPSVGLSLQWQDHVVSFVGTLPVGRHTVDIVSDNPNACGCGTDWGNIHAILIGT